MSTERVSPLNNPTSERGQQAGYLHCPYCGFITKFSGSLERHKSRFHESELARGGVKSLREGGVRNKFYNQPGMVTCPECGVRWGNKRWLEKHMLLSHSEKGANPEDRAPDRFIGQSHTGNIAQTAEDIERIKTERKRRIGQ